MKLLHLDSSILGVNSISRAVSAAIVDRLTSTIGGLEVQTRDLAATPIGQLTGVYLAGLAPDVQHDQALQDDIALGGATLAEFIAADIVVIGCPMYNFTIPSQLKIWVDRVLVAGKTFRYSDKGAEGLMGGKRMLVAVSRGGMYGAGTPHASAEHQESYLRTVFGFMGITDIEFIRAEGIAHGPEQRQASLDAALAEAAKLAA